VVTLRFLLDANVVSEPTLERPSAKVLAKLAQHESLLAIGAPVLHELLFGVHCLRPSKRRARLEDYISSAVVGSMPVLPYGSEAATWHAIERARLAARGATPPFVDGQIAAIAAVHDLTLVTRNTSDFATFAGLRVVSWHK
jgi:tRNA(fMet)-specific endonuclease VapC